MGACSIVLIYIAVALVLASLVDEWVLWVAAIGLIVVLAVGVSK